VGALWVSLCGHFWGGVADRVGADAEIVLTATTAGERAVDIEAPAYVLAVPAEADDKPERRGGDAIMTGTAGPSDRMALRFPHERFYPFHRR
jgi:hypothetical protein